MFGEGRYKGDEMNCQICDKETSDWFLRDGTILRSDPKIVTNGERNGIKYTMESEVKRVLQENKAMPLSNVCTRCMGMFFRVSQGGTENVG